MNEVAHKPSQWEQKIREVMPQFERIASTHKMVRWEEEFNFAAQAIRNNAKLLTCDMQTIQDAVVNVAACGLTLNPADGYAYLVPEYSKEKKGQDCKLRISYRGLIKLATDTGSIKWVKAEVVREADDFTYNGPCEKPEHKMKPFSDRGANVGVYCIAKTVENDFLVDVMDWDAVMKIRGCAKTQYVWDQWPEEMAKKAIIKRAQKQWPKTQKSQPFHEAVKILNDNEGSEDTTEKLQRTADYIIDAIAREDTLGILEAWDELDDFEKSQIWIAKTKGGFFNQNQKEAIRSATFHRNDGEQTHQAEVKTA